MTANSLTEASRLIAGVLGTGAAGVMLGVFGVTWPAFVIDSLTFVASFIFVARVTVSGRITQAAALGGGVLQSVIEGIGVVARSRPLLGTLISACVIMLGLGAINVLFVPLLINDLKVPATWFGAIELAQTSSMVLSAVLLATVLGRFGPTRIITVTMALTAFGIALLAGATEVWHVLILLFAVGWLITPLQASVTTLIQTEAAREAQGRVAALLNTTTTTASVASMAVAGVFGDLIGVRGVFLAGAAIVFAAAVVSFVLFRGAHGAPTAATEATAA